MGYDVYIYIKNGSGVQFHCVTCGYPVFPTFIEETILSLLYILDSLVEN